MAIALVTALAAGRGGQPQDSARAAVASSTPADRATLPRPPTTVELSFTAELSPDLTHVSVLDGSGSPASVGRPSLITPERVSQPVDIAAAGTVTVAYHATFRDGSELTGTLRFTIGAASADAGAAQPPPTTARTEGAGAEFTHQHGVDPISGVLLAVDVIVALAVIVLLIRRPPPRVPAAGDPHV
jgi:methionine-rich copper-binding protein CopC